MHLIKSDGGGRMEEWTGGAGSWRRCSPSRAQREHWPWKEYGLSAFPDGGWNAVNGEGPLGIDDQGMRLGFWRSTHAGATALVAAIVTVMSVIAAGFLVDHLWLVFKRDTLKSAANAASIAATLALRDMSNVEDTDDRVLMDVARRYAWLNLRHTLPSEATINDVSISLDVDRANATVDVEVSADIGTTLFGFIHGYAGPGDLAQRSGIQDAPEPLDLVLAIDVSRSMQSPLDGHGVVLPPHRRIDIVVTASKDVLDILEPDAAIPVRVGLVPWHHGPPCERGDRCDTDLHHPTVLPLTSNEQRLRRELEGLMPIGSATESARGVRRAQRLLDATPPDTRKALVLLSDGDDNKRPDGSSCWSSAETACLRPRRQACRAAKAADIEVFVIAAMAPSQVSNTLGRELTLCASAPENVFLNNATSEALREAFSTIARRFRPLRRVY